LRAQKTIGTKLVAWSFVVVVGWAGNAGAERDNPHLIEARSDISKVRYRRAAEALETALQTGTNGPDQLAEIFKLSGQTAAALGRRHEAESQFKRLLVLQPEAHLMGAGPKIMRPFRSAQAALKGQPPLKVSYRSQLEPRPGLWLVVESDPLQMVHGARAEIRAEGGTHRVTAEGQGEIELALPKAARFEVILSALDLYGNRLAVIGTARAPIVIGAKKAPPLSPQPAMERSPAERPLQPHARLTPIYARWDLWSAVAAVAAGSVGLYFALEAKSANDDLDAIKADSEHHEFSEAEAAEDRLNDNRLAAFISFGVAGGLALLAGGLLWYYLARDPFPPPEAALRLDRRGAQLSWSFGF